MSCLLIDSRDGKKQIEYGSLKVTELCWLPNLNISKESVSHIKPTFSGLKFLDGHTDTVILILVGITFEIENVFRIREVGLQQCREEIG